MFQTIKPKTVLMIIMLLGVVHFGVLSVNFQVTQSADDVIPVFQQGGGQSVAESFINITLDHESIDYSRETHIVNVETPMGFELLRYSAFAHYTTHQDILFEFHMDFNTTIWNSNFTLFNNSFVAQSYRNDYLAIRQLTYISVELLDIGPEEFLIGNDTFFNPANPQQPITVFFIHHRVVIREATAFILSLEEPFRFDLNDIQLGQLEDFQLQVFFDKVEGFYQENLLISAVGSPLEEDSTTQGISGLIRLSEDFGVTQIHRLNRAFGSASQNIVMRFNFPRNQDLDTTTDPFYFGQISEEDQVLFTTTYTADDTSITLYFETDDWMPIGLNIKTAIPLIEQYSLFDYASYFGSGLLALVTIVKGIPFAMRRRRAGKLRRKLFAAAADNDWKTFDEVIGDINENHINLKITADQYKSIYFDSNLLRKRLSSA